MVSLCAQLCAKHLKWILPFMSQSSAVRSALLFYYLIILKMRKLQRLQNEVKHLISGRDRICLDHSVWWCLFPLNYQ